MRVFLLILIGVLLPLSVSARAVTSIKVEEKSYNLIIFGEGEQEEPVKAFNDALRRNKKAEVIRGCNIAIDLPVGVVGGNHSYGGVCSYKEVHETKYVMICTDIMMGRLQMEALKPYPRTSPDQINDLAKFVSKNCYGG